MSRTAVTAGVLLLAALGLLRPWGTTPLDALGDAPTSVSASPTSEYTAPLAIRPPGPGHLTPKATDESPGTGDGDAPPIRTSAILASSAIMPDAEWAALLRSRRDFVRELIERPQDAVAAVLLRSTAFNPRDQWIPPAARAAISATIDAAIPAASTAALDFAAHLDAEFALAKARGVAHVLNLTNTDLATNPFGRDPLVQVVANVTWCLARADAPGTCRRQGQLRSQGRRLVGALARVFAAAGTLSAGELEDLLQQAACPGDN